MIRINSVCAQLFACFAVNMCSNFITGTALGWATAALPMLTRPDSPNRMNDDQIGWIMSIMGVGAVTGPTLTWLFINKIGRKPVLIICAVPMILSYVIITVNQEYEYLLIARVFTGLSMGVTFSAVPVFIGEITDNKIRGALGAIGTVALNSGTLFTIVIAPHLNLSDLDLILALVCSILVLLLLFIPESPYYLMMKGDTAKATKSLIWLKRSTDVKAELVQITEYIENKKSETSETFDLIKKRGNRKALIITMVLVLMEVYSGCNAIPTYVYDIFEQSGLNVSLDTLVTAMSGVSMIASLVGVFVVDSLGRRPVLLVGTFCMAISLIANGIFYTLQTNDYDVSGFTWAPFVGVMGYTISNSAGPLSIGPILMSEYFSTNVKAKASMWYTVLLAIGGSSSAKLFQVSADYLGLGVTFFLCSSPLITGGVLLYFIMPETKGCSLQNIEDMHNCDNSTVADTSVERSPSSVTTIPVNPYCPTANLYCPTANPYCPTANPYCPTVNP